MSYIIDFLCLLFVRIYRANMAFVFVNWYVVVFTCLGFYLKDLDSINSISLNELLVVFYSLIGSLFVYSRMEHLVNVSKQMKDEDKE